MGRQKKPFLFSVLCVQQCSEKQGLEKVRVIGPVPLCTCHAFMLEDYGAEGKPRLLMFALV